MRKLERFENLVAMFFTRAAEKGDAPFLWHKAGGKWHPTSWAEAATQVASLATALKALGLKPGDRVIVEGWQKAQPGQKVQVRGDAAPAQTKGGR